MLPRWVVLLMGEVGLAAAFVWVIAGLIGCYRASRAMDSRKYLHSIALFTFVAMLITTLEFVEVIAKREGSGLLGALIWPFLALGASLSMIRLLLLANPPGKPGGPADPGPGDTKG
jgi:hypothetical protein